MNEVIRVVNLQVQTKELKPQEIVTKVHLFFFRLGVFFKQLVCFALFSQDTVSITVYSILVYQVRFGVYTQATVSVLLISSVCPFSWFPDF
jgi:hypothetical protein